MTNNTQYSHDKLIADFGKRSWVVFSKGSSTIRLTKDEAWALVDFIQARDAWTQLEYDVHPVGWTYLG